MALTTYLGDSGAEDAYIVIKLFLKDTYFQNLIQKSMFFPIQPTTWFTLAETYLLPSRFIVVITKQQ